MDIPLVTGTIGQGMSSKTFAKEWLGYFEKCIDTINSWGLDRLDIEIPLAKTIFDALIQRKNILIIGSIGSGKTKLLNDLLSFLHVPVNSIVCFFRSESEHISEYDLELVNRYKIFDAINLEKRPLDSIDSGLFCLGERIALDHLKRTDLIEVIKLLKEHRFNTGLLCTTYEQNRSAIEEYFDVVIAVDGYKRIKQVTFSIPEEKDGGQVECV